MKCQDCDFDSTGYADPTSSFAQHRRKHARDEGIKRRRAKAAFFALIEATGNHIHAEEAGTRLRIWPNDTKPTRTELLQWRDEWEDNRENGVQTIQEGHVNAMRQRLRAVREYKGWQMVEAYADAGIAIATEASIGTLDDKKQVQIKYLADGFSMGIRDTSNAFETPKATQSMINKLVINAGPPPPKRLNAATGANIIEAEVRELADSD